MSALALLLSSCYKTADITYKVSCSSCVVVYSNHKNETNTVSVQYSWEYTFEAEKGDLLSVSGTSFAGSGVSVKIFDGRKLLKDGKCSGTGCTAKASTNL